MKYLDNEASILIVQINSNRWQIETRNGFILKADVYVDNTHDAEEYVKNYLSSYSCWSYQVVPLKKEGSK